MIPLTKFFPGRSGDDTRLEEYADCYACGISVDPDIEHCPNCGSPHIHRYQLEQ